MKSRRPVNSSVRRLSFFTMALYYLDSHGGDPRLLVRGVAMLVDLTKRSRFQHGAVAVHAKHQVGGGSMWEGVIGRDATKNLSRGQVTIDGCRFYLLTERIDPHAFVEGPVLAAHISTAFLDRVLTNYKATDIVLVPWLEEELNNFKRRHPNAIAF